MKNLSTIMTLVFSLLIASSAHADTQTGTASTSTFSADVSNRSQNKLGAYIGILGDPHPTVLGINVAYNVFDFMRVSVGYGKLSETSSISISNSGVTTEDATMTTLGTSRDFSCQVRV